MKIGNYKYRHGLGDFEDESGTLLKLRTFLVFSREKLVYTAACFRLVCSEMVCISFTIKYIHLYILIPVTENRRIYTLYITYNRKLN